MRKRPFILSTHGGLLGYRHYLPEGLSRWPYQLYDTLTMKAAVKQADQIIVSSNSEYHDAVQFGVDPKNIQVIPMGIDLPETPAEHSDTTSPLRILFVGRVARVRRVELLLQAASQLKIPYQVIVVGGEERTSSVSPSGYMAELRTLVRDLGIEPHVRFEGKKQPGELAEYYRNADVFMYPTLYENFGQPLLEAAAHGLPLITSKVGVACDLVKEGHTGFFSDSNPETIAGHIKSLTAKETRESFGRNLRKQVAEQFGWDSVMERYFEIYRSF